MQKKMMTAVIGGLLVAPAFAADTSVTLYGLIDAGYSYRSDNYKAGVSARSGFDAGQGSGSRLGVRGTEELAPGIKGFFVLEGGINADTGSSAQSGLTWGRQTLVGLDAQGYKFAIGRQNTPIYNRYSALDPFGLGTVGEVNNIFTHILPRADNSVTISTPVWGNLFSVDAFYSLNKSGSEAQGNTGDTRYFSIVPTFNINKTITVQAGYTQDKVKDASNSKQYYDLLTGINLDSVKLSVALARAEDGTSKVNGSNKKWDRFHLGAKVPFGNTSLLASYNYSKDKNNLNEKVSQLALGGSYAFSKRTDAYLTYALQTTSDGAEAAAAKVTDTSKYAYTISDGSNNGLGYRRGLNIGLRHRF